MQRKHETNKQTNKQQDRFHRPSQKTRQLTMAFSGAVKQNFKERTMKQADFVLIVIQNALLQNKNKKKQQSIVQDQEFRFCLAPNSPRHVAACLPGQDGITNITITSSSRIVQASLVPAPEQPCQPHRWLLFSASNSRQV